MTGHKQIKPEKDHRKIILDFNPVTKFKEKKKAQPL